MSHTCFQFCQLSRWPATIRQHTHTHIFSSNYELCFHKASEPRNMCPWAHGLLSVIERGCVCLRPCWRKFPKECFPPSSPSFLCHPLLSSSLLGRFLTSVISWSSTWSCSCSTLAKGEIRIIIKWALLRFKHVWHKHLNIISECFHKPTKDDD